MNHPATPSKTAGRLLVVAAALLWSTSGLFVKSPIFADWPEQTRGAILAFWRASAAAAALLPLVRRPRWRPALVPMTISFTVMCVLFLSAMALTTAGNAIWLQCTAPWWVFLISAVALREPFVRADLLPLGLATVGVALILACEFQGQAMVGVLCGLASGVTYAVVVLCLRRLNAEDHVWLIALNQLVAALTLLPWVATQGIWPTGTQLAAAAAFGVFQMGLPYVLLARGLQSVTSQEAVLLTLIEPVLVPVWVFLAWGEVPAWWTCVGAGLILVGLIVRYLVFEPARPPGDVDLPV